MTTDPQTDLFVPPAAEGLPLAALDSATVGANRLDAWALDPRGRNFLAHALVQLARDGWLRAEPGEGFEPVRDREAVTEPQEPPASVPCAPVDRPGLRDRIARAARTVQLRLGPNAVAMARRGEPVILNMNEADDLADAVLAVLPAHADRGAVLREAADVLAKSGNAHHRNTASRLRRMADEEQQPETQATWTPGPVAVARAAEWASQQRAATVDPAMCPRCKGDNSEAFELCTRCADESAAVAQPGGEPQPIPCNAVHLRVHHAGHQWEPQPGMNRIPCPGYPSTTTQPGKEA